MTPFKDIGIREILPQRDPFLFVDALEHYDEKETLTSFTVSILPRIPQTTTAARTMITAARMIHIRGEVTFRYSVSCSGEEILSTVFFLNND